MSIGIREHNHTLALAFGFAAIAGYLWFSVIDHHFNRIDSVLASWTQLETGIVQSAARAAQTWLTQRLAAPDNRYKTGGAGDLPPVHRSDSPPRK